MPYVKQCVGPFLDPIVRTVELFELCLLMYQSPWCGRLPACLQFLDEKLKALTLAVDLAVCLSCCVAELAVDSNDGNPWGDSRGMRLLRGRVKRRRVH